MQTTYNENKQQFLNHKVRNFDYCLDTNDCYTWAYWAERKAIEIMFVVPSL